MGGAMKNFTRVILLMVSFSSSVTANIVMVPQEMSTIQAALNSCSAGDTILVSPGTYYENLIWPNTENLCLMSEFGRDTTVIDGSKTERVISIYTLSDTNTVINGFTIRNGFSGEHGAGIFLNSSSTLIMNNLIDSNIASVYGGGIACFGNSSPKIINNIFKSNKANTVNPGGGGAIYCDWSEPFIDNNIFSYNQGYTGGAIYCNQYSAGSIINNEFTNNSSINGGGTILLNNHSSPVIMNNLMENNFSDYGGAIGCYRYSDAEIRGNVIRYNEANLTNGYGGAIDVYLNSAPHIIKNIIAYNESRYGGGISFGTSCHGVLDSNYICNNIGDGIYCEDASQPTIYFNNIFGNGNTNYSHYEVFNADATITINAEYNWWGSSSGPYHPVTNPAGGGDTVGDYIDYEPWLPDSVQTIGIKNLGKSIPISFNLYQNYPNPFNPVTKIKFDLHKTVHVVLIIYDILGREVATLVNEKLNAGSYEVYWNASAYSSGVYFYRLTAGDFIETRKMVLLK